MTRKMIINAQDPDEVRIAILNNGVLEEFDIEARGSEKNKGNIYKAVVMAAEPALNAAFVNYGAEKQGFLTAHDVDPKLVGLNDDQQYAIDELLKPKQHILVQVSKDEVSTKGAVLTTYLSLAGRYVVLMPESQRQGISRKIEDEDTRKRMREAASMLDVPEGMGVIIRTAGKDRNRVDLNRDLKVLLNLWENIQKEAATAKAPALIFKEQDVIIRALRDYFSSDIDEVILDSDEAFDRAAEYMHMVMPKQTSVLTRYVERRPIFHHYRVEEQLEALYSPKVTLPSGGSIVIQPTEAMVSIDVNSGKQKSSHHEDTATQTNMEAAKEVARQLRLRDLGGIIVIDFIDMSYRKNQIKVERALKDALKVDKARVKIGHISPNGTLELTRQRIRTALQSTIFEVCSVCRGSGHILSATSHAVNVLRRLRDRCARGDLLSARVRLDGKTANLLKTEKWSEIEALQSRHNVRIDVISDQTLHPGEDDFTFETNPDAPVIPIEEPNFGPAPRYEADTGNDDIEQEEEDMTEQHPESRQNRSRSSELDLPSFEMVEPRNLGLRKRVSGRPERGGDRPERDRRPERGERHEHRGGEQRGGQHRGGGQQRYQQRDQRMAANDHRRHPPKPAPKTAGIRGFFARLFGLEK
jgi:ribonuclease E